MIKLTRNPQNTIVKVKTGIPGRGVPAGGDTDDLLFKVSNLNYDTSWKPRNYYTKAEVDALLDLEQNLIKTEIITLSSADIANKFLTLAETPVVSDSVTLYPQGGIPQINTIDFSVTGNVLSWSGLGLDGFLEENDVLVVQY